MLADSLSDAVAFLKKNLRRYTKHRGLIGVYPSEIIQEIEKGIDILDKARYQIDSSNYETLENIEEHQKKQKNAKNNTKRKSKPRDKHR